MKTTLELGVYEAVASFKLGNIAKCKILSQLGILPGNNCVQSLRSADMMRIKKADKAIEELERKLRQARHLARNQLEEQYKEQEDPERPAYAAGMY